MRALTQDVRYGTRQLFRQRGSSIVAILTLALGIGVSSALFSVIHATMLRPLPYPNPEQLVTVNSEVTLHEGQTEMPSPSMEDFQTWAAADDVFSAAAAWGGGRRIVDGAEVERVEVMYLTEDYLTVHGVAPLLGRGIVREDTAPAAPLVAMLGYGYWQSRYGGSNDVLGTTVRLENEIATVVGVLPTSFNARIPISLPLRIPSAEFSRRGTGRVSVVARLRPGLTVAEAGTRLTAHMAKTSTAGARVRAVVTSQLETAVARYRTTINVFVGAVALIVLMAAVNVAGLLLARGLARQAEIDLRASLGASRRRIIQQLVTESAVMAVPAGALGIALAWLSLDTIVANMPLALPANSPVTLNAAVLISTGALLAFTAFVCGLTPAVRLSRANATRLIGHSHRGVGSGLPRRGGQTLIGLEIALAVVLVVGAALMLRSFQRLSAVDLGFEPDGLITMQVLPLSADAATHQAYFNELMRQLRALPSVASAALVDNFVLGDSTTSTSLATSTTKAGSMVFNVTPGYLETIGAIPRDGRLLSEVDYTSGFRGVVINESAARVLFAGQRPVGRELTRASRGPAPWSVIGVVADLRHGGPLETRRLGQPQVFFPYDPSEFTLTRPMTVVARLLPGATGVPEQMRRIAQSISTRVLVEQVRGVDALFTERVLTPRRRTVLLSLLGALGLTLALVGVFATTAYAVTRRTPEIGLRLAVGARPAQAVWTIVRDSAAPIVVGTAVGVGGAALMTRAIESFLFQTSPTDATALAAVAALLVAAGALAAFVPAMRAARIDPASTLRAE